MKGNYYDDKRLLSLREHVRFYERTDIAVKLGLSAAIILLLLSIRSLSLAVFLLAALLTAKMAAWLLVKILQFAFRKWDDEGSDDVGDEDDDLSDDPPPSGFWFSNYGASNN